MTYIPQPVTGIVHPLVADMFLKRHYHGQTEEDVLVIKARSRKKAVADEEDQFEDYLLDLLADLDDLKAHAERKIGPFDRVDIRV